MGAVGMGMLALIFLLAAATPGIINDPTITVDAKALVPAFIFLAVLMFAFMAVLIFCASVYLKNSSKTYEELHSSKKIVAAIVLSFLFGGVLIGVFGLIGYLTEPSPTTSASQTVETSNPDISSKLQQLKEMKDSGIISEEEFEEKKKDILNNF